MRFGAAMHCFGVLGLCLWAGLSAQMGAAQDKSASTIVALPDAGGTVTKEEGALQLTAATGAVRFALPLPSRPIVNQVFLGSLDFRSLVRTPASLLKLSDHPRIGVRAFNQYVVTLDFTRNKLFFEWPIED